jgi:nucleoside-diphosphate-sugar epimerase
MMPLISGATGFLGTALLRRTPEGHLLLRGGDADQRAARASRRSGGELRAVSGDIESDAWGLSDEDLAALRGSVSVVVNLAAVTDWSAPTARLNTTNIDGAVHGVAVAARLGVPYFHISSLYAAYRVEGEVPEALVVEDGGLTRYERSKCRAEWRVAQRCEQLGVPCTIARVGGLAADLHATPGNRRRQERVPFVWLLDSQGFGVLPYADGARVDVSPRDLVVDKLVELLASPPEPGTVMVRNVCLGAAAPTVGALFHELVANRKGRGRRMLTVPVPRRVLLEGSTIGDRLSTGVRARQAIGLRYLASSAHYASEGLGVRLGLDDLVAAVGFERRGVGLGSSYYSEWSRLGDDGVGSDRSFYADWSQA